MVTPRALFRLVKLRFAWLWAFPCKIHCEFIRLAYLRYNVLHFCTFNPSELTSVAWNCSTVSICFLLLSQTGIFAQSHYCLFWTVFRVQYRISGYHPCLATKCGLRWLNKFWPSILNASIRLNTVYCSGSPLFDSFASIVTAAVAVPLSVDPDSW